MLELRNLEPIFSGMKLHQKIGVALMAIPVLLGIALQKSAALLYRPETLTNLEIIPPPPDLTLVVALLSTNWLLAAPLALLFVIGIAYISLPERFGIDTPQLVEIRHLNPSS